MKPQDLFLTSTYCTVAEHQIKGIIISTNIIKWDFKTLAILDIFVQKTTSTKLWIKKQIFSFDDIHFKSMSYLSSTVFCSTEYVHLCNGTSSLLYSRSTLAQIETFCKNDYRFKQHGIYEVVANGIHILIRLHWIELFHNNFSPSG